LSGGEMSLPSQEYFAGIGCPSEKAVLVIWRFITFGGLGLSAPPAVTEQPSIAVANNTFICAFMVQFYSAARRWERKIIHHSACAWSRGAALWSASSDASGFRHETRARLPEDAVTGRTQLAVKCNFASP
jgi:hypothetical protein